MDPKKYDLIVIGGGPSGMAAAVGASSNGVKNILILERMPRLGGILNQCIHLGFGLNYFKKEMTGTEYAAKYKIIVYDKNIEIKTSCLVHKITGKKEVTFVSREGEFTVSASNLIMATGCRERTREMLTVPGTRPAGIFTAGLAQEMVNIYGVMPGKEVVIVGSGDIGLIMARRMTLEGAKVHLTLEIMDHLSGLIRNKVQCLDDFGIPLHLEHELMEIIGKNRVEAIKYRNNKTGKEKLISCDTILFSVGLIPEQDLLIDAGISTGNGIYLTGNADYVHDLVDSVTKEAEKLGESIR
ncbi:MAG: FAD-dependent oxidoreductase [Thermodesulfobacteriota bacterium]|nr:FAD-dependent oxidoreductase [Thermodesulfobacteriota bacterium]